ncbi:hypothetical protein P8452_71066 [Trifolium repens]|nr:hypothetical protein P8452_71066 [Trifolium repens]
MQAVNGFEYLFSTTVDLKYAQEDDGFGFFNQRDGAWLKLSNRGAYDSKGEDLLRWYSGSRIQCKTKIMIKEMKIDCPLLKRRE